MTDYGAYQQVDVNAAHHYPNLGGNDDLEANKALLSPKNTVPSTHSVYANRGGEHIKVKAKLKGRYREFQIPTNFQHSQLVANLKEKFDLVQEVGADRGTAYLLWLFFGFFGVHRFYLKQHNALSWFVWFITGQLFIFGWLYDGLVLWNNVDKFNKRRLHVSDEKDDKGLISFLFGFKEYERPSMVAAYLLWFFFGWIGVHRWYTGYHSASSFTAWFVTGQMFWMGWFYDAYYTARMVNYPRMVGDHIPFFIKAHDNAYDYMPVRNDDELSAAVNNANLRPDKTLRLLIVETCREDIAYVIWFFLGTIGGHALYLDLGTFWVRFFTGNYFFIGYIIDGIRMQDHIDRANQKLLGDFVPSTEGGKVWPHSGLIAIDISSSV